MELALEGLQETPLNKHVAMESRRIKLTHKDPGGRFIAATALVYDFVLVTADRELLQRAALKTV